jgi:hypothetical protein
MIFQIIVGVLFVLMGGMKLMSAIKSGEKCDMAQQFKKLGVPFVAVYPISIIELVAGLGLIFSMYVQEVQWVLLVIIGGATLSHLRVKDFNGSGMAVVMLVLLLLLMFL